MLKAKKGAWTPFPLSTNMCKIETVKQAKDEVNTLSSFRFKEMSFRRHDPEGLLKEHMKQINFIWPYSHEELFPGELSQQGILVKCKILTLEQMMQIDKEIERKNVINGKRKYIIEHDSIPSTSSISLYNIDFDNENSNYASSQTPSLIKEAFSPHEQGEEMTIYWATVNISSENHLSNNSMMPEPEGPSSYNIEEIFGCFTFDLHRKEVSKKKFWKVKESDGTLKDINEDEVLYERTDEDPMLIDTSSIALDQASVLNISMLNEKSIEQELNNKKLLEENINLTVEMKNKRMGDDHLNPVKQSIMTEQELL